MARHGYMILRIGQRTQSQKKTQASEREAKVIREALSLANEQSKQERHVFDELLKRHDLRRTLRIQSWVRRFTTHRARKGPLTSEGIQESKNWWIRRVQSQDAQKPHFEQTRRELNLRPNANESSNVMAEFKDSTRSTC